MLRTINPFYISEKLPFSTIEISSNLEAFVEDRGIVNQWKSCLSLPINISAHKHLYP
jgi:hypothetical protein